MSAFTIDPNTTIGAVTLAVADLERALDYYQDNIGLRLHRRENGVAVLGVGGPDLLVLEEQRGARPVQAGRTGLYHFAILTPSRHELARTLRHLWETSTPIGGSSDHAVSEALYLSDPDGHGIEIYRDRPRAEWPVSDGRLQMTLDPLDVKGIMSEVENDTTAWSGLHSATTIGHIHLHVAHIPAAEQFYVDTLGFDLILRYGASASFISAGGYHHHMGLNTWAGVGVPPPPHDAARLLRFEVRLPDGAALESVAARVRAAGLSMAQHDGGWLLQDPAQNSVVLTSASQT